MTGVITHWSRPNLSVGCRRTWCGLDVTGTMKATPHARGVNCEACKRERKAKLPKIRADFAKRKRLAKKLGNACPWNVAGT